MDYIDWNNITEEIDLDFLQPLLDQVSQIYSDQWENAQGTITSSDPYGSSIREENLADAFENYNAQSAQQQSDILTQYHGSIMNNRLKAQLEKMQEQYEKLTQEYSDYKTEQDGRQDAPMPLEYYMNLLNMQAPQTQQSTPAQAVQSQQQQQQFQPWPPPGVILNPEMLTEYHPFDDQPGWGELPSQFQNIFYPSQQSGQQGLWWDKNKKRGTGTKPSGKRDKQDYGRLDASLYKMPNSPTMRDMIMEHINYYYGDQAPNINQMMQNGRNPALLAQRKGKNAGSGYVGKTGIPTAKSKLQQVKAGQNNWSRPQINRNKKLNTSQSQYSAYNAVPRPPRPGMKPKQPPRLNKKIRKIGFR
ncbi:MAG: hypothetical protein K8T10_16315 [Candidatus Eremiobacteraeota bacterium]|nr:hypothetical protein [Candidatus Eremiobacteraeota bacterium]